MRRRYAGRADAVSVQLFPFLAVLLCTIGALCLLLVVIARQAKLQAEHEPPPTVDPSHVDLRDELKWRVEMLAESRDKTSADLAERRRALSHIEDHLRRLRDELQRTRDALVQLDTATAADQRGQLEAELADINRRLAVAHDEFEQLANLPPKRESYAIVPYVGPNQTQRRPIYIECLADRVIIQPEGICLHEEDFSVAADPRNPLAGAVRAAAEHISRQRALGEDGTPYPLLLVRPDGIGAYYAARAALQWWDSDFGYECIEADWPIEYRPADPALADAMARAVDDARARQVYMAKNTPRAAAGEKTLYRASPTRGGLVSEGGREADSRVRARSFTPPGVQFGGDTRRDYSETASFSGGVGGDGIGGHGGSGGSPEQPGSGLGGFSAAPPGSGDDEHFGTGQSGAGGPSAGGFTSRRGPELTAAGGSAGFGMADGAGGNAADGDSRLAQAGSAHGGRPGQGSGGNSGSTGSSSSSGQGGARGSSGAAGSGAAGGGGASGAAADDPSQQALNLSLTSEHDVQSLARRRGDDWALPNKTPSATPVSRPITVLCDGDRLVIASEHGPRAPGKVISLTERTADSVDEFVGAVWDHIDGWGIAGRNMYWKPILSMQVTADGARRFSDLQQLLSGSGLEMRGKPIMSETTVSAPRTWR